MQYGKTYLVKMAQGHIEYSNPNVATPECVKKLNSIKDEISNKHNIECTDIFSDDFYTQAETAKKEAKEQGYTVSEFFNVSRNEIVKTWETPEFRAELQMVNEGAGELTIYKK